MEKQAIIIPTNCPVCGSKLVRNGPFLECSNSDCGEVKIHQIMKWIGKMDIMHLARKTVDKLMEAGLVSNIADLYKIKLEQVQNIDGLGMGFQRVIDEINRSRNPPLAKFLAGFDMDGIGERIWQPIIDELNLVTLNDVFGIKFGQLLTVPGISEIRATAILENLAEMGDELIATAQITGISSPVKTAPVTGNLTGKSFCFTGALNTMKRADAEKMVLAKGGTISSVKKGLTYLVTNDSTSGSAKNQKAQQLGIALINEIEFLELVK
jgi:DNA ligase (NAD+)